jgi:hypothetical protein
MKKLSGKLTALQLEFNLTGPGWASTISIDFESRRLPVFARRSSETTIRDPNPMKTSALVIALVFTSHLANAAFIYHDSATSTGGVFNASFPITNLKNAGHTSHEGLESTAANGASYATTQVTSPTNRFPVLITLDFTEAVDLSKFYLWNHSNNNNNTSQNNGVRDFTLTFFDGASGGGSQIGSVFTGVAAAAPSTANTNYAAQAFDFGSTYADVRSIRFLITSKQTLATDGFVAVREIGFEAIPEPSSALLGGLGLLALLRRRR